MVAMVICGYRDCTNMSVGSVVPGGGAYEVAAYATLTSSEFMASVPGRAKYGVKVGHTH